MIAKPLNRISNEYKNVLKSKRVVAIIRDVYNRVGIFLILVLMVIGLSFLTPNFLTTINITNIIRQISFIAIIGLGSTMVIIIRGIDVSPGAIVGLTSVVVSSVAFPNQHPIFVTILIGLTVGTAAGALSGTVVAKTGIPPFIMTLGMMTAARGAALIYSGGRPISGLKPEFIFLGAGEIIGVPIPIVVLIAVSIIIHVILTHTRFGRHIYAVGGNEQAAILSGINVVKVRILVFTIAGFLASLAGIILTARIASGQPGLGAGYEFDAIAASVIGGTSLSSGGIGSVFGIISGALVIGVINNGMDLLNFNMYWQQVIRGVIIVTAVIIDNQRNRKR